MKDLLKRTHLLGLCREARRAFCRLADVLADGACAFRPNRSLPSKIRKVLAVRLDRIGDLVLTTPALRAVKDTYPEAYLAVLVRRYTKDLIEGLDFIDEVIVADDHTREGLIKYLRSASFDVSLGFHPDLFVNFLPWRCGIPYRVGYKYCGSSFFLTVALPDDRQSRIRHEVDSALEVAAKIGAKPKDTGLSIAVREDAERFCENFFRENGLAGQKVVAVHPGSRQPHIRWDQRRFAEVADRLIREKRVSVVLIGSEDEKDLVDAVAGFMKEKAVKAVGMGLAAATSVLKRACLFIGNSTGPMHMAAALKVPVVAIFGNIHPKDSFQEWGPWDTEHVVVHHDMPCKRCHPGDCLTYDCIEKIFVDEVFGAAVKLLKI